MLTRNHGSAGGSFPSVCSVWVVSRGCPPEAPTDPNVRDERIRFLESSVRCAAARGMDRPQVPHRNSRNSGIPGPPHTITVLRYRKAIPVGLGRRSNVIGACSAVVGGLGPPYWARRRIRNDRFGKSHCFAGADDGTSTVT
jgi:hypothetical protein